MHVPGCKVGPVGKNEFVEVFTVRQGHGEDCVEYICDGSAVINFNTSAKRCRVQGAGDKDGLLFKNEFD